MKLNKITRLAWFLSRFINKSTTNKKHVAAVINNGKVHHVKPNNPGLHAEYLSYLDFQTHNCNKIVSKYCKTLIVIRFENGTFKNSKPCKECIEKLKLKVKRIIYSTGDQSCPFICEKLSEIKNSWQSNLVRKVKDNVYTK